MQLVGAKNSFIRRPFIRRSIVNALIASFIAISLLALSAYLIQIQIGPTEALYNLEIIGPVVVTIFTISLIINYIATIAAVNRYLRMRTEQLYFV